ncbi:diacylglycerol kinase family protein [Weissella koreensis]|uniref:Diacylglycerol kinase family protein n=1 Tax=Weissella koreensis TaxID=165096 RepID=A0A7H1MN04_9LACO|nr:diacylglycerol kinase family protein [Weissella koreensis]AEJ24022.1 diacylglycerol kinase [Weissella koreensis KACC 15510]AVH75636.1 UDP kinase [Weissella koreensis]EJF34623.1 diacylglycerol kinase [Weissella koreensis KCTC 3621]MCZ9311350.1 diacylglycerol kinase family protein [Weissella koreensis]QGN20859.1 UDP kinase [Weissella koreensis]
MTLDSNDNKKIKPITPLDEQQVTKNSHFLQSFGHAVEGIGQLLVRERNMRFHFFASVIVIYLGFHLRIGRQDWLWTAMAIFAVVMSEFVNTMIETMVDLIVGYEYHPLAKIAKDVAAGAVVFAVMFAMAVGVIVFYPYVLPIIEQLLNLKF